MFDWVLNTPLHSRNHDQADKSKNRLKYETCLKLTIKQYTVLATNFEHISFIGKNCLGQTFGVKLVFQDQNNNNRRKYRDQNLQKTYSDPSDINLLFGFGVGLIC